MKIAVTGASGFIGRHVLAALKFRGVKVIAVTRNRTQLAGLDPCVQVVEMDIGSADANAYDDLHQPDAVIHLAWDGLPNYKSLHHFEVELPKHYRFLRLLVDGGLPALLVSGTCFEYGMQSGPLSADTLPLPSNPYGYAKDALRKQLTYLANQKHFKLTWGRLFYMYGEGQPPNSLYPLLRAAVARGDRVFNMSGGEQLRDYLHVDEVSRKIIDFAVSKEGAGVVNICSGKPISVRQLVEQWVVENSWKIDLNLGYHPYPDYEPMAFWGIENKV